MSHVKDKSFIQAYISLTCVPLSTYSNHLLDLHYYLFVGITVHTANSMSGSSINVIELLPSGVSAMPPSFSSTRGLNCEPMSPVPFTKAYAVRPQGVAGSGTSHKIAPTVR